MGIAILAAGLMGAWHVTKYAVPRAIRAVGAKRSTGIAAWKAGHPDAPAVARWGAALARTFAALRWGPRYLARETRTAWREGLELGRHKYGQVITDLPTPVDEHDASDQRKCVRCETNPVAEGDIACPQCRAWQDERDAQAPPLPGRLFVVPNQTQPKKEKTMPIQTATGGEIVDAEQFMAEAKAIVSEAAAELEDASGDSNRAQEDFARIERMVGSLKKVDAMSEDIGAVAGLHEPAQARAQAAKDRLVAAEQRLAVAKNVEQIAAKHVQLIGRAVGRFYKAG